MKILCWNVRGLSWASESAPTLKLVLELSKRYQVPFICLLETKSDLHHFDFFDANRFPSWESSTNFHLIENGRIGLFWDTNRVTCDVLEVCEQHMHLQVHCKVTQHVFLATFIYNVYSVPGRRDLWEYLAQLGASITSPWIVLGDFNYFLSPRTNEEGRR
ncbi:hypothetical protein LIER_38781 [Lithospermum erythrorhizon]|uniref:Endonuclease/exonuclease/phosphatase domain-containing protein n=1 Tax=Lithospermum erythrorhizon TaxID=34254 RepID=A0AAV3Q4N5_LITER